MLLELGCCPFSLFFVCVLVTVRYVIMPLCRRCSAPARETAFEYETGEAMGYWSMSGISSCAAGVKYWDI